MKEPIWIHKEDCLAFHTDLLARFGGLDGIRDEGLLDSALNRPIHVYTYENPSLCELAAQYAFGIVKNHPFLDGNKRTGLICAALFLEINGARFQAPEVEAVLFARDLAAGTFGAEIYAEWLKRNTTENPKT